ncbi:MAG: amidohydrolase [Planctomycetota bacterium]|nr:MAG: amidohydrolase [Planctomycetota bacterium]REK36586.1 MAG: amidohydrolase [Planctomycetota bacterium]
MTKDGHPSVCDDREEKRPTRNISASPVRHNDNIPNRARPITTCRAGCAGRRLRYASTCEAAGTAGPTPTYVHQRVSHDILTLTGSISFALIRETAMNLTRREFVQWAGGAAAVPVLGAIGHAAEQRGEDMLIIDTHQHLWDLEKYQPPWLESAPEILNHKYGTAEYLDATSGHNVKCVYMEVDVAAEDKVAEAEHVVSLCKNSEAPTIAAVIGGRPDSHGFKRYINGLMPSPYIKGVRQVLHNDDIPPQTCLKEEFVDGVQFLGEQGLSFDLCMRPGELRDGLKLTELCPDTRFIVDHCGNADPKAFGRLRDGAEEAWHDADEWKRDMQSLADRPNVICKISGIVARAPEDWTADDLAPIVNHCLDAFGPKRVVFGGDWPVCLLGAPLKNWIGALSEIIAERPEAEQRLLWSENAIREYSLEGT